MGVGLLVGVLKAPAKDIGKRSYIEALVGSGHILTNTTTHRGTYGISDAIV